MTVRIVSYLEIDGDGPTETAIREACTYLDRLGQTSPEWHEMQAQIAMMSARIHWRDADRFRGYQREHEARLARRQARESER